MTAANAASAAAQPHVAQVSVSDTAADVQASLGSLEALAAAGKLGTITLTDAAKPTLTLTAAQAAADSLALSLIGSSWSIAITGTAGGLPTATVSSVTLSRNNLPQITLTDATERLAWTSMTIALSQSGVLLSEHFNWRAGQPYMTTDQNFTNGQLDQTWNAPSSGGYVMSQNDLTGSQQWSSFVQTVDANNQLVSLDYSMRAGNASSEIIQSYAGGQITSETDKDWNGGWRTKYFNYHNTQAWSYSIPRRSTLRGKCPPIAIPGYPASPTQILR